MRHAKSSWDNPASKDIDRPLNTRGEKDALAMARWLKDQNLKPDHILCSPAARTRQTAQPILRLTNFPGELFHLEESMYFSGDHAYLQLIQSAPESSSVLLFIGHNPMTESIVNLLSSQPVGQPIKTATIASLSADVEAWNKIQHHSCRLNWIVNSKELPETYR